MHILFLTDNFPPETNAPANRIWEHARLWVAAGAEVTIVTCFPNFPEGKVYPGYRNQWRQEDTFEGIRVIRVWSYVTANEGFLKRSLDYLSFVPTAVIAGLGVPRPDVIVATSPQFFCALAGWITAALRRRPFVFEVRDLWPASIAAVGAMEQSLLLRMLEKLELFLYRRARGIVVVTEAFRHDLIERGIAPDKITVARNGVDLDAYQPRERDPELARALGITDQFVVGYVGTHGMAHALEHVVEAARLLRHRSDIVFLFAGAGAARKQVESQVRELGLDNVRLLERQPKARMPAVWSVCDVSVVPLRNTPVFATVIPSKIFECMAMGLPMIVSVPDGEATGIVKEAGAGLCIAPESPEALVEAIVKLANDPKQRATLAAAGIAAAPAYARERQAALMLQTLQDTAAKRA